MSSGSLLADKSTFFLPCVALIGLSRLLPPERCPSAIRPFFHRNCHFHRCDFHPSAPTPPKPPLLPTVFALLQQHPTPPHIRRVPIYSKEKGSRQKNWLCQLKTAPILPDFNEVKESVQPPQEKANGPCGSGKNEERATEVHWGQTLSAPVSLRHLPLLFPSQPKSHRGSSGTCCFFANRCNDLRSSCYPLSGCNTNTHNYLCWHDNRYLIFLTN